jgi:hypothetical protein
LAHPLLSPPFILVEKSDLPTRRARIRALRVSEETISIQGSGFTERSPDRKGIGSYINVVKDINIPIFNIQLKLKPKSILVEKLVEKSETFKKK